MGRREAERHTTVPPWPQEIAQCAAHHGPCWPVKLMTNNARFNLKPVSNLMRQQHVPSKVFGAESYGGDARACGADRCCVHHTTRCLYPRDDAEPATDFQGGLDGTQFRVNDVHVVGALDLTCRESKRDRADLRQSKDFQDMHACYDTCTRAKISVRVLR
jgi:hypothetical protein